MTAACTFDIRQIQIDEPDGSAGSAQDATGMTRDASEDARDSRAESGGAGGSQDAALDGPAGAGGAGAAGKGGSTGGGAGGAAGASGNGGIGGAGGRGGAAGAGAVGGSAGSGTGGASGGTGGRGGATSGGAGGSDGGMTGGTAGQGGSATGGSDGGTTPDVRDSGGGGGPFDAADGGIIVLYEETFDSALGTFTLENGCGPTPPVWSNIAGYAHAAELATLGVSSIYSPSITVPSNVSELRLRMSHKVDTDEGYDGGQLLISVNNLAAEVVRTFTAGPYTMEGSNTDPITCEARTEPSWVPAWSGPLGEFQSEVNLSAAPFNVVAGDTVSIRFRMLVDYLTAGNGWDIDWVRLTARSP